MIIICALSQNYQHILKNYITILKQFDWQTLEGIKMSVGQVVFELLIKTCKTLFWPINQEPLGLLKFWCLFCIGMLAIFFFKKKKCSLTWWFWDSTQKTCSILDLGCTPLINPVRHHLASQCFEKDYLAALPCLSKCQKKIWKWSWYTLFCVRCALLVAFSTSCHRKSNISKKFEF